MVIRHMCSVGLDFIHLGPDRNRPEKSADHILYNTFLSFSYRDENLQGFQTGPKP